MSLAFRGGGAGGGGDGVILFQKKSNEINRMRVLGTQIIRDFNFNFFNCNWGVRKYSETFPSIIPVQNLIMIRNFSQV